MYSWILRKFRQSYWLNLGTFTCVEQLIRTYRFAVKARLKFSVIQVFARKLMWAGPKNTIWLSIYNHWALWNLTFLQQDNQIQFFLFIHFQMNLICFPSIVLFIDNLFCSRIIQLYLGTMLIQCMCNVIIRVININVWSNFW